MIFILGAGCGKMEKAIQGLSSFTPSAPALTPAVTGAPLMIAPGSFFKVTTDVGDKKDTRVYEIQYLSSGKFIVTVTSFPGGNLSSSYFHKKTGTYKEESYSVAHYPESDTCGNVAPFSVVKMGGNKAETITLLINSMNVLFYSYLNYALPADVSSHIPDAVEDVGCVKFKDDSV
ncbi:MAG: hypothetical protein ACJ76H_09640 [Bacteriovoracaceae bacterium]